MMESLRNFLTGPRLLIVVLICALPFVFLGTGLLTGAFGGSFGSINGEDVTEADLQLALILLFKDFKAFMEKSLILICLMRMLGLNLLNKN